MVIWEYKNTAMYNHVFNSLSLHVMEKLGRCPIDSASWLWNKLALMYEGSPEKERLDVLTKPMVLKFKDGKYATYFIKFDLLVARLKKMGYRVREWMIRDVYIMDLGDYYYPKFNSNNREDVRRDIHTIIKNNKR
jgi:hypothetical protein